MGGCRTFLCYVPFSSTIFYFLRGSSAPNVWFLMYASCHRAHTFKLWVSSRHGRKGSASPYSAHPSSLYAHSSLFPLWFIFCWWSKWTGRPPGTMQPNMLQNIPNMNMLPNMPYMPQNMQQFMPQNLYNMQPNMPNTNMPLNMSNMQPNMPPKMPNMQQNLQQNIPNMPPKMPSMPNIPQKMPQNMQSKWSNPQDLNKMSNVQTAQQKWDSMPKPQKPPAPQQAKPPAKVEPEPDHSGHSGLAASAPQPVSSLCHLPPEFGGTLPVSTLSLPMDIVWLNTEL